MNMELVNIMITTLYNQNNDFIKDTLLWTREEISDLSDDGFIHVFDDLYFHKGDYFFLLNEYNRRAA